METDSHACEQARQYFDARLSEDGMGEELTQERKLVLDQHLKGCQPCLAWQKEVTDITVLVANMPQYNVPESLTQNILASVELENGPVPVKALNAVLMSAAAFISLLAFLFVESIESVSGMLSWGLCFAIMIAIAQLVQERPVRLETK